MLDTRHGRPRWPWPTSARTRATRRTRRWWRGSTRWSCGRSGTPGSTEPGGGPLADQGRPRRQRPDRLVAAFNSAFRLKDSQAAGSTPAVAPAQAARRRGLAGDRPAGADRGRRLGHRRGDDAGRSRPCGRTSRCWSSGGQLVPGIQSNQGNRWGATIGNAYYVWRSGHRRDRDRRGGVRRGGPPVSALTLAELLQRAGAVRAMELDINPDWTELRRVPHGQGRRIERNALPRHEAVAQPVRLDLVSGLRRAVPAMTASPEVARTRVGRARELVRALRPRQWPKNLLVFAAPMAAGDLGHPRRPRACRSWRSCSSPRPRPAGTC